MSTAFAMTIATGFLLALMVFRDHDIGGEIWGPVAGATALVASILTFAVHRSSSRVGRASILLLWVAVISLGIAGAFEHAEPVLPGSLDQRWRPPLVPLVYSLFGAVGIMIVLARARVVAGSRATSRG
ncbi:MAG: hypothetical protein AB1Z67_10980 [Candidatus Limnocylindrales bacterium]